MALCGGGGGRSRVAVALILVLLLPLLATAPCAHARELLGGDHPAGAVENGEREAAAGSWTVVRGPPAFAGAGRRTTSGLGNAVAVAVAARVLGSVPSPGVGH